MREMKIVVPKMVLRTLLIFLLITASSCATTTQTLVSERDTIYIDHFVERNIVLHDTVEIISRVVEYIADSTGGWLPQRMVEERSLQLASQNSSEGESIKEEIEITSESRVEELPSQKNRNLFIAGVITAVVIILILRFRTFI
jgi:hypothetical protein